MRSHYICHVVIDTGVKGTEHIIFLCYFNEIKVVSEFFVDFVNI